MICFEMETDDGDEKKGVVRKLNRREGTELREKWDEKEGRKEICNLVKGLNIKKNRRKRRSRRGREGGGVMEEERFVWSIWLKLHSGKYSQLDKAGKGGRNEAADKLENFQYAKTIT